jgi:hypothetical protein
MQFKLGQKVKVLIAGSSLLKDGDVGFISEVCSSDNSYRVEVEGRRNYANWIGGDDMEMAELTGEEVQEYLKSINMEEQMLRQLMMTMPMGDVSYYYAERVILGEKTSSELINNQ